MVAEMLQFFFYDMLYIYVTKFYIHYIFHIYVISFIKYLSYIYVNNMCFLFLLYICIFILFDFKFA